MKSTMKFALLGATALFVTVGAAQAQDKVVIYKDQLVKAEASDANFQQLDVNDDHVVTYNEFNSQALLRNNAEVFNRIDANDDGIVTVTEFRDFEKNASKLRTVTELVGYEETITFVVPTKDDMFARIDENGNGVVEFKEFQRHTMIENKYDIFHTMDSSGDDLVSVDEYRAFDRTKGQRVTVSDGENRVEAGPKTAEEYAAAETHRFVPAKRQNFGTRDIY